MSWNGRSECEKISYNILVAYRHCSYPVHECSFSVNLCNSSSVDDLQYGCPLKGFSVRASPLCKQRSYMVKAEWERIHDILVITKLRKLPFDFVLKTSCFFENIPARDLPGHNSFHALQNTLHRVIMEVLNWGINVVPLIETKLGKLTVILEHKVPLRGFFLITWRDPSSYKICLLPIHPKLWIIMSGKIRTQGLSNVPA